MSRPLSRSSRSRQFRTRDPAIETIGFTCFRLVREPDGFYPIELMMSSARMFAFVR